MKKIKLSLNESLVTNINSNQVDVIEDISTQQKPDYQIIDITVIPDEEYNPTIQSILIDLDESCKLCESEEESKNLSINILSETVNVKTGYSNSLFEFENANHTITLSLVLQETERNGVYKVEAYTTKGEKVFESNTYKPKKLIESYLNSLANEYLIDKKLNEAEEQEVIKTLKDDEGGMTVKVIKAPNGRYFNYYYSTDMEHADSEAGPFSTAEEAITMAKKHRPDAKEVKEAEDLIKDDVKEDLAIECGSDEEQALNDLYDDYYYNDEEEQEDAEEYSVSDFVKSLYLIDEIKSLGINYSNWNDLSSEERINLVTPKLTEFYNKHSVEFEKSPDLFNLILDNLDDENFHTEAEVLRRLYENKEEE